MTDTAPGSEGVASALAGFATDFRGFRSTIESRLADQADRLDALDRKAVAAARPPLEAAAAAEPPHAKAFGAYLRSGDEDAMRALEAKGLSTAVAAEGGALVDPVTSERVETVLRAASPLRALARVVNVEATAYDALIDHTEMGADWTPEAGPVNETATPLIDRISIPLHELSATPRASQRLLDDSAFDVEGWLAERIATRFARAENRAFVDGDGIDKPKGFLTHPRGDAGTWGQVARTRTGEAGGFGPSPADTLIDFVYALGSGYRGNATFLMNSATAGTIRRMKDADGRYLWAEGLADGQPARLLGYPVAMVEEMPDIGPDQPAIAFGDMRAAYTVAERPDLRVLRDPYSAKPNVLFYATKRVGGDVTDFEALRVLEFGT